MSGFKGAVAIATAVNRITKLLQSAIDAIKRTQTKEAGAAEQRERDLRDDIERNRLAREAANDPALDDPDGVLSDKANRRNQNRPDGSPPGMH